MRAEDATTPTPIEINGDTATVEVKLYADENHTQELKGAVTSTSKLYGAFSAQFKNGKAPTPENLTAVYTLPNTIVVDDNAGGDLMAGSGSSAVKAGTWKTEANKVIFTFEKSWLESNPANIFVAADFAFELANKDVGSGDSTKVSFPGTSDIDITTKDGNVSGTKKGVFSQSGGKGRVSWTLNLQVESHASNVQITDVLGNNFSFVPGSFKLNGQTLSQQPNIDGQTAKLALGNLSQGTYTITYDSVVNPKVSIDNYVWINELDGSKNNATWTWGQSSENSNNCEGLAKNKFRYDMIKKSEGIGTPADITWTVTLNNGDIKTDMNGYKFTDALDDKQVYTDKYIVYKGLNGGNKIAEGDLSSSANTFSYIFSNLTEADRYQPYRIVYHTKMRNQDSYVPVENTAKIEHEGTTAPSGTSTATFSRGIVGQLITKELISPQNNGRATWTTHVKIPETVDVSQVKILDTFKSTYRQHLKVESLVVKIGDTTLAEGNRTSGDYYFYTRDEVTSGKKINFNIQLRATDTVMNALKANGYQIDVTYTTVTDNLDGQYWNLAAMQFPFAGKDFKQYSSEPYYIVNNSETPDVDKSSDGFVWDGNFDWSTVDQGSTEKGAWIATWTVYANRYKTPAGEYYGAGKLDGKPIKIVDTLPANGTMSFVPGSARYTLYANPYEERREAERVVVQDRSVDGIASDNEVSFSVPTDELGDYAGYAKLTYKTAIKRSVLDTSTNSTTLKNTASAESGDKKFESGSGTVTIKNHVIKKTGEQVASSNRVKYTILVNESAVALKSDSDFLELVDTMDAKCTLVPSTLKVYEWAEGTWSPLADKDYSVSMDQISDESSSRTKLTLNVPDRKYLKVEYEVIPTGNPGDKVSLSNTAELTGVTDGSATDAQTWTVKKASASAGGNGYGITMTKYDAQQVGATLKGAEFTLYSVDMDQAATAGVENAKTLLETAITDANGKISFGTSDKAMNSCTLYQLVETKAPVGYAAAERMWIMLKGTESDEEYQAALEKAKSIVGSAEIIGDAKKDEIWVYDNRLRGSATIRAKKVLEGGTFKKGQFSFALKDGDDRVLQTVTNDAEGNVSFNVDYNKEGTYTYTISEVEPKGAVDHVKDHITYDTTPRNVTVKVTNGADQLNAVVTYNDSSQDPPTFTNKYSTTLPEAGGAGLTMTYLAGSSLLCFAAAWMHARRHRDQDRGGRRE